MQSQHQHVLRQQMGNEVLLGLTISPEQPVESLSVFELTATTYDTPGEIRGLLLCQHLNKAKLFPEIVREYVEKALPWSQFLPKVKEAASNLEKRLKPSWKIIQKMRELKYVVPEHPEPHLHLFRDCLRDLKTYNISYDEDELRARFLETLPARVKSQVQLRSCAYEDAVKEFSLLARSLHTDIARGNANPDDWKENDDAEPPQKKQRVDSSPALSQPSRPLSQSPSYSQPYEAGAGFSRRERRRWKRQRDEEDQFAKRRDNPLWKGKPVCKEYLQDNCKDDTVCGLVHPPKCGFGPNCKFNRENACNWYHPASERGQSATSEEPSVEPSPATPAPSTSFQAPAPKLPAAGQPVQAPRRQNERNNSGFSFGGSGPRAGWIPQKKN